MPKKLPHHSTFNNVSQVSLSCHGHLIQRRAVRVFGKTLDYFNSNLHKFIRPSTYRGECLGILRMYSGNIEVLHLLVIVFS